MANLVLKITHDEKQAAEAQYVYKDIDAFSDKYVTNKVDMLVDVEAVKAAVRNIFMWSQGEEILFPKFGNGLKRFLYQPIDEVSKTELSHEVKRCIEENEPRVVIDSLGVDDSADNERHSVIRFQLNYHVIGSKGKRYSVSDTITINGNDIANKEQG